CQQDTEDRQRSQRILHSLLRACRAKSGRVSQPSPRAGILEAPRCSNIQSQDQAPMSSTKFIEDSIDQFRLPHDQRVRRNNHERAWDGDDDVPMKERKKLADEILSEGVANLARTQECLYAADSWSILIIFQAMDAAGKDSTIKHVMSGVNPQGVQVTSFKHPS